MSLSVAGVWQVGVWDQTVWADGVWREGAPSVTVGYMLGAVTVQLATTAETTVINATTGEVELQ